MVKTHENTLKCFISVSDKIFSTVCTEAKRFVFFFFTSCDLLICTQPRYRLYDTHILDFQQKYSLTSSQRPTVVFALWNTEHGRQTSEQHEENRNRVFLVWHWYRKDTVWFLMKAHFCTRQKASGEITSTWTSLLTDCEWFCWVWSPEEMRTTWWGHWRLEYF